MRARTEHTRNADDLSGHIHGVLKYRAIAAVRRSSAGGRALFLHKGLRHFSLLICNGDSRRRDGFGHSRYHNETDIHARIGHQRNSDYAVCIRPGQQDWRGRDTNARITATPRMVEQMALVGITVYDDGVIQRGIGDFDNVGPP